MKLKTMEAALKSYPNRFQLTMMAVTRAKEINDGDKTLVPTDDLVKPVVAALQEIAGGRIIPATQEYMIKIREAKRVVRERALMEAAKDLVDDDIDEGYAAASAEEPDRIK